MLSTNYLYGDAEVPPVPEDVIMRRVEILKDRVEEVNDQNYMVRDYELRTKLLKAIDFWEAINER